MITSVTTVLNAVSSEASRGKYLVLQPDGSLAGLDRAAVVDVLSRRTDAWTYRGRRAAWVSGRSTASIYRRSII